MSDATIFHIDGPMGCKVQGSFQHVSLELPVVNIIDTILGSYKVRDIYPPSKVHPHSRNINLCKRYIETSTYIFI